MFIFTFNSCYRGYCGICGWVYTLLEKMGQSMIEIYQSNHCLMLEKHYSIQLKNETELQQQLTLFSTCTYTDPDTHCLALYYLTKWWNNLWCPGNASLIQPCWKMILAVSFWIKRLSITAVVKVVKENYAMNE